jgi:Transglycosylase SLT domain
MRLTRLLPACAILLVAEPALRAEYVNLAGGERLHVSGYQLLGDKYRLQVAGGVVEVPAQAVLSIDPEDDFASIPPPPVATAPFHEIVKAAATRYSVDADLITSVIAAESNFDPKAVSRRNARGLMQLLPETAARFGVRNIFDPQENIDAGTHYLRDLLQRYNNDLALALAAYNAGPERVQQFGSVPPYPETVSYIRRVKRAYDKSKSGKPVGQSTDSAPKPIAEKTPPNSSRNEDAAKANPSLDALN